MIDSISDPSHRYEPLNPRVCLNRLVDWLYRQLDDSQLANINELELDQILHVNETSAKKLLQDYEQACQVSSS